MSNNKNNAVLLGAAPVLIGSQFAVAAAAIFAKFALLGAGATMVAALRLTIAALILSLLNARVQNKQAVPASHERLFSFCGFALAVHFVTWIASLNLTSVAIATLLVSTAPVWITLYDVFFLRRRPSKQFWIGFFLTVFGSVMAVFSNPTVAAVHSVSEEMLGAILSAIGGLAFACYLVAIRKVSDEHSTLLIVSRTYSWSAAFLWMGVFVFQEKLPGANLTSWAGIFGMAIFSQLLGHTGMNRALKTFSPNVVALSTLLEPVFAAVLALFIFGEELNGQILVSALLIISGLIAVMLDKTAEPEPVLAEMEQL